MNRLNALAKEAKINDNASIKDQHSIIINAPIEKVWSIILKIEKWPEWNAEITKVRSDGTVQEGSKFEWSYNQSTLNSEIQLIDPPNAISWTTNSKWAKGIYVWQLEQDDKQTIATVGLSLQGTFVILMNNHQRVYKTLLRWLDFLKSASEK